MTEELRQKLSALRSAAPRLNAETDEAAKVVQAVEQFLEGLSLGVSAEVCFESNTVAVGADEDKSQTDAEFYLTYGRLAGKYRLHVVEKQATLDDRSGTTYHGDWTRVEVNQTPWSSCPRETKLKSFASLPSLLGAIADKADDLTAKAAETTKTVKDLLDALDPHGRDRVVHVTVTRPVDEPEVGPVKLSSVMPRRKLPGGT